MSNKEQLLYRIPPFYYIHVLDQNKNICTLVVGPQTYLREENQKVVLQPTKMVTIPPRHYCVIENPVLRNKDGQVVYDDSGEAKLAFADLEIRFSGEPFPLFPGENMKLGITPLQIVAANCALRLRSVLDFKDSDGEKRIAGDEWLFEGPGTYTPRKEVEVKEEIKAIVIKPNQGLRLRAKRDCIDRNGTKRVTGEEWIIKTTGAYIPNAYEEVIGTVNAFVLTEKKALHIRALKTFVDESGKKRLNGDEWLIKASDAETYIPGVYEQVIDEIELITLNNRQYCVILDPVDDDNKPQLGKKKLVKGEKAFFLQPGENIENGIQETYVLCENEGLVLKAIESFVDDTHTKRVAGDRWVIRGPMDYIPPVEVQVVTKRVTVPLNKDEGIYVRNTKTGVIRTIIGEPYMLNEDEELWQKELPSNVEYLVSTKNGSYQTRDKTKVVNYHVPNNRIIKIYNYNNKRARIIFGPESVLLAAEEEIILVTPVTILLDILFFSGYIFYLIYAGMVSLGSRFRR